MRHEKAISFTCPYITLVGVTGALSVNLLIDVAFGARWLFFLFLVAAFISTFYEGWKAGLLATSLTSLAILFFFVDPIHSFAVSQSYEWVRLATFSVSSIIAIMAAPWIKRIMDK